MAIQLTQEQTDALQNLYNQQNYPAAYSYLADVVRNTPGADQRLATWLDDAASINANNGSLISEYVRDATWEAAYDQGQLLTRDQFMTKFQDASNFLADGVIRSIVNGGQIGDLDTIIKDDVRAMVEQLGLTPEGWAGTGAAWLPTWMGGLGLDVNSPFYKDLYDSFRDRGIDNFFEIMAKWADIWENSLATLDVVTETLVRQVWQSLNTLYDQLWGDIKNISDLVSSLFTTTQTFLHNRDPLTFDLDGDGLETVALNTVNPIMFDHDGDGVKTATAWISPHDGFLVLDRNANGVIDSGQELFGDSTPIPDGAGGTRNAVDGFEALQAQDTNLDGKVDANDANFANLRIWQDLNQDGLSQTNELFTLTQKNIASINVTQTQNNTLLPNGNVIADLGTYTKTDGTTATLGDTAQLGDVDLRVNTFYSQFTDPVPLTPEAQALPGMRGSGQVRDLREAASLSGNLTTLLTNYSSASTRSGQMAQLDTLIKAWSDTSTMATTATGAYAGHPLTVTFEGIAAGSPEYNAWLDKLTVLERFNGRTFDAAGKKREWRKAA